jgi:HK97 family phage portal protein
MNGLTRIGRGLAGLKRFRFPTNRTASWGSGSWLGGTFPILPGARYDYRRDAGPLYLSGPVWSATQWLARNWQDAPHVVYERVGDEEEQLKPHPLTDLLAQPNRWYDASVLWMSTLLSWCADGNAYWSVERSGAGVPVGLIYIPHHLMTPIGSKDGSVYRTRYDYRRDGETIPLKVEDVIHFQNGTDPANYLRGLSPLAAELRAICTDNEAQTYTASILRNMGVPGAIISPKDADEPIPPEVAARMKELFRDLFTGDNRGDVMIPSLPVDVQNLGFSPEQMALDKIARMPTPRILSALGIDPMLIGLPSDSKTYANMEQAREGTYEQVLMPLQGIFDSQLTLQLMPQMSGYRPGIRLGRDYSKVRALAEDMDKLHDRLTKAVGGPWLSVNEARAQVGLDPVRDGDSLYPQNSSSSGAVGDQARGGNPQDREEEQRQAASVRQDIARKWRERRELAERNGNGREA